MAGDSEDLVRAIVEWSHGRPLWVQRALRMLAKGEPVGDEVVHALAELAERQAGGEHVAVAPLETADLLGQAEGNEAVSILGISHPKSVNALTWSEGLQFAPKGVTVVYGQNGSGKSGYARILKKVTRARHATAVLGNVFEAPSEQSARLSVSLGSNSEDLTWPSEQPDLLGLVSFYDRDCGSQYISADTEVVYRPGALALLDELVQLAGRVGAVLEERRSQRSRQRTDLPQCPRGSRAAEFLTSLSADTTRLQLDIAVDVPGNVDDRLADLRRRIVTLETDDSDRERMRLSQVLTDVEELSSRIEHTREVLSESAMSFLVEARTAYVNAREAAEVASAAQFRSEPVSGVGGQAWKILWEAARRFSEDVAYPEHRFPVTESEGEPARCVLCLQSVSTHAAVRLRAFDEFVSAELEQAAQEAQGTYDRLAEGVRRHEILDTGAELSLQRVGGVSEQAHAELRSALELLADYHSQVIDSLDGETGKVAKPPALSTLTQVPPLVEQLERQVADLEGDDREEQLGGLHRDEAELEGRLVLRNHRPTIEKRIAELKKARVIEEAIRLTATRGITRKAADLMRSHVSDVLKHRFSQETLLLGLEQVRLADAGGSQGNLKHRALLVDAVQSAPLDAVLSEGQQTALSLAGFLTEVESDSTASAVVFDDPVTSLDHVVQERVAARLVRLATQRQVIVFTHEIAFVLDLKKAAEAESVPLEERWVTKSHTQVGQVSDGGPWDGKVVRQRLHELNLRLTKIRKVFDQGHPDECHREVRSWYQDLRTVWERALEEAVLGPVLVRGKLELHPGNLKVFVDFTQEDDQEFQAAFRRCGERGSHDASSELNRPLPRIEELEDDLEAIGSWHKRVKRYAS